jgi:hypothetical protein
MHCTAINRKNGRPCKNWPLKGADLCLMHSESPKAKAAAAAAKAKLRVGGPRNEDMPAPEISALMDEQAAIVATLRPVFLDEDGRVRPENQDLVGDYADVRLYVKELRKTKPLTQAKRRELDAAIKRRDDYRDRLGLGGPSTREKFDSLEAQQKAVRAKQGATPVRSEERAMQVALLLQRSHAIPTLPPLDDEDEPNTPPLTAVEQNGEQ